VVLLFFLRIPLLAYGLAAAIFAAFLTLYFGEGGDRIAIYAGIWGILYVVVSVHLGLLPSVTMNVVLFFLFSLPATPHTDAWYFAYGLAGCLALFAVALAAAIVACQGHDHGADAGRPEARTVD
jgi:hypothetical protein